MRKRYNPYAWPPWLRKLRFIAEQCIIPITVVQAIRTILWVMGEKGSTILIVGTLAATYLSAATLFGIAGISYSEGLLVIAALESFGAWIGTLLAVIYVGRKLKALNCQTMPDFFEKRFQNKWVIQKRLDSFFICAAM
ncbi:hypothetical protein [Anoxybacillus sp. CHMUD]|uniref:sodium:solute symporter family transporter n=1 Tax=Anoxybacillus sp. CHMUD TaxID=2508870 RepID=UPI0035C6C8A3